jgi:hypothetical protein
MKRNPIKLTGACTVIFALVVVAQTVAAATIISETGRSYAGYAARTDQFDAISWSQTGSYTDVNITARLYTVDPTDTGTAWITTRVGPGTTLADQIATASFSFPSSANASDVILFTGLTLDPGTYYLTIGGGTNYWSSWYATDQPVPTMDTGVTYNGNFYIYNSDAYAPASPYVSTPHITPIFSITGTVVPEPTSLAFIGITVSVFILFHRPRFANTKRNHEHDA